MADEGAAVAHGAIAPSTAEFAGILKKALTASNGKPLAAAALARRTGLSRSTMYAYLAGSSLPSPKSLDLLLTAVGVPAGQQRRLSTLRDAAADARLAGAGPAAPLAAAVAHTLPADPGELVGRAEQLAELTGRARAVPSGRGGAVALTGPAGVGKTGLALRWAHQHIAEFADGAVYLDLGGYAVGPPREPGAALAELLRAFGADDTAPPDRTGERLAQLRTAVGGRKPLVILDNALDDEQLRVLLAGLSTAFVLITSRDLLPGLSVAGEVARIPVRPLDEAAALDLVQRYVPSPLRQPAAVTRAVVARCAGLPLALRIVAGQLGRGWPTGGTLAVDRLLGLPAVAQRGRQQLSLREVLGWSERRLPESTARALRLLAVVPLARLSTETAAAALGQSLSQTSRQLRRLLRAHLLEPLGHNQFRLHDLVRGYARERALAVDDEAARTAAEDRLIEHFVGAGQWASQTLFPATAPTEDVRVHERRQALDWFDQQWPQLVDLIASTVRRDAPAATVRLVQVIRKPVLEGRIRVRESVELFLAGLAAARSVGDRAAEATLLRNVGSTLRILGNDAAAIGYLGEAAEASRKLGDDEALAGTVSELGNVHLWAGRLADAIDHYQQALRIADRSGSVLAAAIAHNNLSIGYRKRCDHRSAMDHANAALAHYQQLGAEAGIARTRCQLCEIATDIGDFDTAAAEAGAALTWARTVGSRQVEVEVLNVLGEMHRANAQHALSRAHHVAALAGAQSIDDDYEQARAHEGIGWSHQASAEVALAQQAWRQSFDIYRAIGADDADRVEVLLTADA